MERHYLTERRLQVFCAQVYYLDQSTFVHAVSLEQSDEETILVCTGSVLLEESSKENGKCIRNLGAESSWL